MKVLKRARKREEKEQKINEMKRRDKTTTYKAKK